MAGQSIELIPVESLIIDLFNPRHPQQKSQRDAIHIIAHDQGNKLFNLAEDIVDKGLNPSDLVMVTASEQENMYVVLEGNRRVAALKLLASPQLLASIGLPSSLEARYRALQDRAGHDIPVAINCAVLSREESIHWIQLKHTGENEGIGIVPWDGVASQRFRGSSPSLQAIEMVENGVYLDDETKKKLSKISITNIERVLGTPEARRILGFDVKNNQLIVVEPNEEEALARLAMLVSEVANKTVKVTDLDKKEQRVEYAQKVAQRAASQTLPASRTGSGASSAGSTSAKPSATRRISPLRKTLVPRDLKLTIHNPRINKIYHELQKINIDDYVNCCAVMFRVFIELSADHYGQEKKISLKVSLKAKPGGSPPGEREMSLREKITAVSDDLERNHVCNREQLKGIRSLVANREHVLSVDSLNAYVHNKDYNPTPTDLKANWDSIQEFVRGIWIA